MASGGRPGWALRCVLQITTSEARRDPVVHPVTATIDWGRVAALWAAAGRTQNTVAMYLYWARRFEKYCQAQDLDPIEHLTLDAVRRINKADPPRRRGATFGRTPIVAVRALACALAALGHVVPPWSGRRLIRWPPLIERYLEHRSRYRGVAAKTRGFNGKCAAAFMKFIATRRRTVRTVRIVDIDAFVISRTRMFTTKTVAGVCRALRSFLRYLHVAGLIKADLAVHVMSPRLRTLDRPPRAVPWNNVRRIVRAIEPTAKLGLRDRALFLMMATYGMGAAEVIGLQLQDLDWRSRLIRLRRPKTGVVTELPMLDSVAHALAVYVRRGRPPHASTRAVFVSHHLPHGPLSGSTTIRHRLALHAERAGVRDGYLGTHLFRHSHATRQVEEGRPAKVVGDILGHRRPASTSAYTRSAVLRLRAIALPVPR